MASAPLLLWLSTALLLTGCATASAVYSSRLIHRFSEELRISSGAREGDSWPVRGSLDYYQRLLVRDFQRQKVKLGHHHQLVFPSEGSQAVSFGNDLGWLHYTWIDIGTPNISFLVALDDGSDLLWVPCNCIQCYPLSASFSSGLGRDLNEYDPARSSTSRNLYCGHEFCGSDSDCKSSTQPCPYVVNYYSANTSSSGIIFEDILHLSSSSHSASNKSLQASIILGCGRMQSGGYLDGVAPDGLLGLGLGEKSVPSFLAKSGLVRDSFSLCFSHDGSGTIFFGDQGPASQKMTPILPINGIYKTYMVDVDACCIGEASCLKQSSFKVVIDSGSSFSLLPPDVYDTIVREFDRQVNATRKAYDGYAWEYCYESSGEHKSDFPSMRFILAPNNSFVIHYPMFPVYEDQEIVGYCLTVRKGIDVGIFGQDFMTGNLIVFDRENLKLGWSHSDCMDLSDQETPAESPANGGSPTQLPSNEQQSSPRGHAVAPAIAGKAPSKSSAAAPTLHALSWVILFRSFLIWMLFLYQELFDCHIRW